MTNKQKQQLQLHEKLHHVNGLSTYSNVVSRYVWRQSWSVVPCQQNRHIQTPTIITQCVYDAWASLPCVVGSSRRWRALLPVRRLLVGWLELNVCKERIWENLRSIVVMLQKFSHYKCHFSFHLARQSIIHQWPVLVYQLHITGHACAPCMSFLDHHHQHCHQCLFLDSPWFY